MEKKKIKMGRQAYFLVHHECQLYLDETSQRLNLVPQKDGEYQTFLQGLDKPCLLGFMLFCMQKSFSLQRNVPKPGPSLLNLSVRPRDGRPSPASPCPPQVFPISPEI